MSKSAQRARAREKAYRQERESLRAAGAWSGKRVSFATRRGVASDFPARGFPAQFRALHSPP